MNKTVWLFHRIKAMPMQEILWRVAQKCINWKEEKQYKKKLIPVIYIKAAQTFVLDPEKLGIQWEKKLCSTSSDISLFETYDYTTYRNKWHAGFQTKADWPLLFSYNLNYKQREDIGDVRTNWELNRHFQLTRLAKDFYITGEIRYFDELQELFENWNQENPFLHGISWTSPMEIAIRTHSWVYAYCFLAQYVCLKNQKKQSVKQLVEKLGNGIIVMTEYVVKHYSRYSSANNHVLVEAAIIGIVGVVSGQYSWETLAVQIINEELIKQNYQDGVNKEMSAHYQLFGMEAVGLFTHILQYNNRNVPDSWIELLKNMTTYLVVCTGTHGEFIAFGDDDAGKILDLGEDVVSYHEYVLQLMSCILGENFYLEGGISEYMNWMFDADFMQSIKHKKMYHAISATYQQGGYTIWRSSMDDLLIGIDHGALGYGKVAAHGHADALSFQLYRKGAPVFVDAGTYNYHFTPEERNYFRHTCNHNTVTINATDQSEMLGPFLWGRKAKCTLVKSFVPNNTHNRFYIEMMHDGYAPVIHRRAMEYKEGHGLIICDSIENVAGQENTECNVEVIYMIAPKLKVRQEGDTIFFIESKDSCIENIACKLEVKTQTLDKTEIQKRWYSAKYNSKEVTEAIVLKKKIRSDFRVETKITF